MGTVSNCTCGVCGTSFWVRSGGGFFFDLLHCDICGKSTTVSHEELGEIHLGYIKGLRVPYAIARAGLDAKIQAQYTGPVLTPDEYTAAAEATLAPCECGGTFRYAAPPRCPTCRSTEDQWTVGLNNVSMIVD